jgi:CBS domain-containing protein
MLAKDFITKGFPALKSSDTSEYALSVMGELKIRHLPVVSGGEYVGLLSEEELLGVSDRSAPIPEPLLFAPSIGELSHLHVILERMAGYHLSVLPVLSLKGKYMGVILRYKMLDVLADLCNAESSGSVVVLELQPLDYALSDIARIIEANNAHVLNLLLNTDKDTGRLTLMIKIDLEDATPVIRSFERFNYTVLYHFMEREQVDDVLQRRMEELLYYVNM